MFPDPPSSAHSTLKPGIAVDQRTAQAVLHPRPLLPPTARLYNARHDARLHRTSSFWQNATRAIAPPYTKASVGKSSSFDIALLIRDYHCTLAVDVRCSPFCCQSFPSASSCLRTRSDLDTLSYWFSFRHLLYRSVVSGRFLDVILPGPILRRVPSYESIPSPHEEKQALKPVQAQEKSLRNCSKREGCTAL
jgi:hypothetical protein